MMRSLRRITNALMGVGIVALSVGTLATLALTCSGQTGGCLASLSLALGPEYTTSYAPDVSVALTTVAEPPVGLFSAEFWQIVQVVGLYAVVLAFASLIALEAGQLHYTRKLLELRRSFRIS